MLKDRLKTYAWLFGVNFFISSFAFGGGYVVVPMIRKYFVQKKNIITDSELIGMAAMAQSAPGAIAVNLSALAGFRAGGFVGAFLSCLAAVTPPLIILSIVSLCYATVQNNHVVFVILKGMQAGVAALIVDLVANMYKIILKERSFMFTIMTPAVFIANFIFSVNIALLIGVCVCLSGARVFLKKWGRAHAE